MKCIKFIKRTKLFESATFLWFTEDFICRHMRVKNVLRANFNIFSRADVMKSEITLSNLVEVLLSNKKIEHFKRRFPNKMENVDTFLYRVIVSYPLQ